MIRRRYLVLVVIAAVLVGAVLTTDVLVARGWSYSVRRAYQVWFYMKDDSTQAQRDTMRTNLGRVTSDSGVRTLTGAAAYNAMKETDPAMAAVWTADSVPAAYEVTLSARQFPCAEYDGVAKGGGLLVASFWAMRSATERDFLIYCGKD